MELLDGSEFAVDFLGVDKEFASALAEAFPDDDVVTRSSFSGMQVISLVFKLSKQGIDQLAKFLSSRKITIDRNPAGRVSVTIQGYGAEDVPMLTNQILRVVREAKRR